MQANPYLNFNGDCVEAFKFYERSLGGKIESIMTHRDSPIAKDVPPAWQDRVLHARLRVGDTVLMASDSPPEYYQKPQGLYVSLQVDTPAEAERIFRELSQSGSVTLPIEKTFWAERFGMLVDRFGIPWMVNCEGAAQAAPRQRAQAAGKR
ncbi:MAG TPA: VOC family protein [Gemmatimonadales bacterium]|jgi:PhnB protein|nr:VOC family protein [Gemmatimonadales bacterium]